MNRNLRTLAAAAALVLVLSAGAAVVYAYLQHQTAQSNPFQIGTDTVAIQETFTPPPQMGMQNSVEKTVTVANTGTGDQYVRVFLDFSDSSARDRSRIVYTRDGSPVTLGAALGWCVVPYLIPDGIKIVLAALLARRLHPLIRP